MRRSSGRSEHCRPRARLRQAWANAAGSTPRFRAFIAHFSKPRHHPRHTILTDVGVDLRGREIHVPEQRLDVHELGAGLEQPGGVGVPRRRYYCGICDRRAWIQYIVAGYNVRQLYIEVTKHEQKGSLRCESS